ncbi:Extracellular protein [Cladobotryum mycophilum]|uniref:Extracellular protein n=1 Tax=Cladobotryum mycophilum TaxID=491253 RepID=A0ABR0SWC3_9HYPO
MHRLLALTTAAAVASLAAATPTTTTPCPKVPSLNVPRCPRVGTITYNKSVPNLTDFPLTQVDLCYSDKDIEITFTAYNETNFYFNSSQGTNGDIWEYEVMEAFIYQGTDDPQTYLEFEVNPNNVTYQAFVYNPSKVRAPGAPFDHFFVSDPATDGFSATTKLDKKAETWKSHVTIPLGLFNVNDGKAKGTKWRMNFFRTVVSPETYPDQGLGAWSPPNQASFHISPYFGKVTFV